MSIFSSQEVSSFKCLFSKFCRQQINEENCTDNDCVDCCVNAAYEKMFEKEGGADE